MLDSAAVAVCDTMCCNQGLFTSLLGFWMLQDKRLAKTLVQGSHPTLHTAPSHNGVPRTNRRHQHAAARDWWPAWSISPHCHPHHHKTTTRTIPPTAAKQHDLTGALPLPLELPLLPPRRSSPSAYNPLNQGWISRAVEPPDPPDIGVSSGCTSRPQFSGCNSVHSGKQYFVLHPAWDCLVVDSEAAFAWLPCLLALVQAWPP
jgi:hypothetical protein